MALKRLIGSISLLQTVDPPDVLPKQSKRMTAIFRVSQLWAGKRQWRETNTESDRYGQLNVSSIIVKRTRFNIGCKMSGIVAARRWKVAIG